MDNPTLLTSPYQPGGPIKTERTFIGRSDAIDRTLSLLDEAKSNALVIEGQHHVGKTSLIHQVQRRLGAQNECVFFSLQDYRAGHDLAGTLHDLGREIMKATPRHPYGIGHDRSSAEHVSSQLIDLLNQIGRNRKAQLPFVVLLDELAASGPTYHGSPRVNPARYFEMIVLRCPTTKFFIVQAFEPGAATQPPVRILRQARRLTLGYLTRAEVAGVCRLSEGDAGPQGLRWTHEAIDAVYAMTDGHPLLVQTVCAGIWQRLARAESVYTVAREDLEGEVNLSLILEQAGDTLAQVWDKLGGAARVVMLLAARLGCGVTEGELEATILSHGRSYSTLRQAYKELREAGFLVAAGDGMRCSPPLLDQWAGRQDISAAGELEKLIGTSKGDPQMRTRAMAGSFLSPKAFPPI